MVTTRQSTPCFQPTRKNEVFVLFFYNVKVSLHRQKVVNKRTHLLASRERTRRTDFLFFSFFSFPVVGRARASGSVPMLQGQGYLSKHARSGRTVAGPIWGSGLSPPRKLFPSSGGGRGVGVLSLGQTNKGVGHSPALLVFVFPLRAVPNLSPSDCEIHLLDVPSDS